MEIKELAEKTKIYIAGPITGVENFKDNFQEIEQRLIELGHVCMNPATLNKGFEHSEYMHVCYAMLDICNAIYMLPGWQCSKGAKLEFEYAKSKGKIIINHGGWHYKWK